MADHPIPELDRKGLRDFGLTTGAIVAGLFGLFFPWFLERPTPLWPWVIAAILVVWGLVAPLSLRPVYRGWMRFGLLLSKITTPLIMGILFFLIFVPAGLVMRLLARDPLSRRRDAGAATYRVPGDPAARRLDKPY